MVNVLKSGKGLVLILVALIFISLIVFMGDNKEVEEPRDTTNGTVNVSPTTSPVPARSSSPVKTKTYTELVAEFNGRRIQFDINCQAIPNYVTFKEGTQVMFDNRSGEQRFITIGGVSYSFPGYGYKILTMSADKLPATVLLSCGSAINVGQILIQN